MAIIIIHGNPLTCSARTRRALSSEISRGAALAMALGCSPCEEALAMALGCSPCEERSTAIRSETARSYACLRAKKRARVACMSFRAADRRSDEGCARRTRPAASISIISGSRRTTCDPIREV